MHRPNQPELILASSSPRRQELLRETGVPFQVHAANINEDQIAEEAPIEYALRLAREKAEAVAVRFPQSYVLGADTIVVIDGQVLGKPRDQKDAAHMLRLLSGREHEVTTAVSLIAPSRAARNTPSPSTIAPSTAASNSAAPNAHGENAAQPNTAVPNTLPHSTVASGTLAVTRASTTKVFFREITEAEIQQYVAGGEPMDKAGAYAIQGGASRWTDRIEGEFSNVVGLPLSLVTEMLKTNGLLKS